MQSEFETLKRREVWKLMPRSPDRKILGSRWVFTYKKDDTNKIVKFKARLVAQGHTQIKGQSYDEVFSPVINFTLIRVFFVILVVQRKWVHLQLDVTGAYLYAPLSEEIFINQPKGFEDPKLPNHVCLLKKALYGLHQSGKEWFAEINKVLLKFNFRRFESCNCVYSLNGEVVLLLYVDDIVLIGKTQEVVNKVVQLLRSEFEIVILGRTKRLLGVEFIETNTSLAIHQKMYIEKLAKEYHKFNIPITSLPIAKGTILSKNQSPTTEDEKNEVMRLPYRSLIGSLAYLAGKTRPDISYAVNVLSQFQENPGIFHWDVLLKVLGYVNQSKDYKLDLSCEATMDLICFSDADFATNRDDRVSMGSYLVSINRAPISWRAFKQKTVSLSTMESELISMTEAAKEIVWIQRVLAECGKYSLLKGDSISCILYADNQAAISFAKSDIENHRTKHIDVKLHYIRHLINEKLFELKFVSTKNNVADFLTKPHTKVEVQKFVNKMFTK